MAEALRTHACNAYCAGETHCDLFYTGWMDDPVSVAHYTGYALKVDIVRIKPAPEAQDLADLPVAQQQCLYGTPQDGHRWLIWWKLPPGRWVMPTARELRTRLGQRGTNREEHTSHA